MESILIIRIRFENIGIFAFDVCGVVVVIGVLGCSLWRPVLNVYTCTSGER